MDNNFTAEEFKNFVENLKRLYGEYFLIKMTKEEEEKYILGYAKILGKTEEEAKSFVRKMIKAKKRSYEFAKYNSYKNDLIERYGEFYFTKMNFEEKKVLVTYYYKAKKAIGSEITMEEAFKELYDIEYERCENRIWDYQLNLERLENLFGKNL